MSDGMANGFFMGLFLAAALGLIAWHTMESVCQAKYNVADCELSPEAFTPAGALQ